MDLVKYVFCCHHFWSDFSLVNLLQIYCIHPPINGSLCFFSNIVKYKKSSISNFLESYVDIRAFWLTSQSNIVVSTPMLPYFQICVTSPQIPISQLRSLEISSICNSKSTCSFWQNWWIKVMKSNGSLITREKVEGERVTWIKVTEVWLQLVHWR